MAGNTTTVTHPDGTVSKRTSKTNIYTHAIQVSPADPQKLAEYLRGAAERADRKAVALRFAAANSKVVIRSRGWSASGMNDLHSHQATLKDTDKEIYTWCSADGRTLTYPDPHPAPAVPAPVDAYLRAAAIRSAEGWEANAAKMRAEADTILAAGAPVGEWTVERWSSRQDLAQKAVRTFAYLAERGHQVRVVPVDLPKVQAVDPSQDCADTCCTEVQDPQDTEDPARVEFTKANPDARIVQSEWESIGWEVACEAGPVCANWRSNQLTESAARAAYVAHRTGRHVRRGDIVTIHRGVDPREVLRVEQDMSLAQVGSLDPEDARDPWWVSLDLLHQAERKVLPWGQVVELAGKRYAVVSDGETPYLRPLRG